MRQTHKRAMVNENNLIVCHRVARLVDACASAQGVDPLDVYRETRARHVTRVRHMVMYMAYRCKAGTMRQIARALGRDHSVVVGAVAAVEKIRQADEGMDAAIRLIETRSAVPRVSDGDLGRLRKLAEEEREREDGECC